MDYYRNFFAKTGFRDEAEAIGRYLSEGNRAAAARSVTDRMQRTLAVFGGVDYCRQEIQRRRDLGVQMPVIAPFAFGGALNSYHATIEALAPRDGE